MSEGQKVTFRLLPGKEEVYQDFKDVVTERLHSDVCYVTTMLMESFVNAVQQTPNPDDKFTLHFVKQNVQVNMGCTFQYYTKKARRTPQDETAIITDRHNLIPDVVSQYPTLKAEAQQFWINELRAQGWNLEPPKTQDGIVKKIWLRLKHCMTFVSRRLWG